MLNNINISPKKQILIVYVVLILAALAVFGRVTQYGFINFDDPYFVYENSQVMSGITPDSFLWAFHTKFFGLWHPLIWLSFMFDYEIYGLNPGGYHLTNIILHILSTLMLFWLFCRMTGAIWKSAFVAAFFALHPLHVESVAWISERKDVLSTFFCVLTLCFYAWYTEKPKLKRYLLIVFSFMCALASKPSVVILPLIMLLLDLWPLERLQMSRPDNNATSTFNQKSVLGLLWEKIPFFILSGVIAFITFYSKNEPYYKRFPLVSRIANAPVSFVNYLEKTFWPHDLSFFYPFSEQLPILHVLGAILLILVISIAVIVMLKRIPYFFTGWIWYAITIFPAIGIVQTNQQAMADRYHYLPSIGIAIGIAWGIPFLIKNENIRKNILFPAGIAFLTILSVMTWKQAGYWKNNVTLISHALQITRDIDFESISSDLIISDEKNNENNSYPYNKVSPEKPLSAGVYNNRGNAYTKLDMYQAAIDNYNEAIRLKPDFAEVYFNRGTAYGECGHYQQAIEDFNKAIGLKPDYIDSYYNRGTVYAKLNQYNMAVEDFSKVISLKPDYVMAYFSRGFAYLLQGNYIDGCRDVQKVCSFGDCQLLEFAKSQGRCR